MRDDSVGEDLRRQMSDRSKVNIALFPSDATDKVTCRLCSVRMILVDNDTCWMCPSCGEKLPLNKVKYEGSSPKARYGPSATKQSFIISQQPNKKKRDLDIPEGTTTISSVEYDPSTGQFS